MGAGFFLRGLGVFGAIVNHNLVGRRRRAAAGLGAGACRRAICASWAPMDCSSQAAQFGPAVLEPGAGIFQAGGIGPGAGQRRRFGNPKQHVIEGIQIPKNGERRRERGRTLASAWAKSPGRVALRSRCMEATSC